MALRKELALEARQPESMGGLRISDVLYNFSQIMLIERFRSY